MQNYLLPFSVRILEAMILAISSNSFSNQAMLFEVARLLSRSSTSHNLLSLADLRAMWKKFVNSFLLLATWAST